METWDGWECSTHLNREDVRHCDWEEWVETTLLAHLEEKNVARTQELVDRYFKHGEMVVNLFSGTFAAEEPCFELPRHCRFLGCKVDTESSVESTEALAATGLD